MNKKPLKKPNKKHLAPNRKAHFKKKVWLISVAASLTIIIAIITISIIINRPSTKLSDAYYKCANTFNVDFSVYLKPGTPKETLESMADIIRKDDNVKSVEYSTSEEEVEKRIEGYKAKNDEKMLVTYEIVGKDVIIKKQPAVMRIEVYDATNNLSTIKHTIDNNGVFTENLDSKFGVSYPSEFSTIKLLDDSDNGKVIEISIMEDMGNSEIEKIGCVCEALDIPDRIKDAITNTEATDETQQESWNNLIVKWYHKKKRTRITSEFYTMDRKLYITIYEK